MYDVLLSPPDVGDEEIAAVVAAMRSGWIAPVGPDLAAFEVESAERFGTAHAVGLSSGTAALHLALVAWGVGPGDVVPVSTLTFAASVNAIRYVGAEPHFVDCERDSGNMSPALLGQAMDELSRTGRQIPVVIPVDMLGKCVDYDEIGRTAAAFGSRVLCDAAESAGASYRGRPAGSFGEASVLSFNGNKIMTTSSGGMLLTSDSHLAQHVRKLSTQARESARHYEHAEVGFNYRLSNLLAALGRAQLRRLDEMKARRRVWREKYRHLVGKRQGLEILGGTNDESDNCWLTALLVDPVRAGRSVVDIAAAMDRAGVETRPLWKPMHLQPVFRSHGGTLDGTAETMFKQGITLPSGSAMTDEQFSRIEAAFDEAFA